MKFTLVSTVYNEIQRVAQTISDLAAQSTQPSEIIITDAGSTDGTYEKLLQWKDSSSIPIIVLQQRHCNVAEGRNLAISLAKYSIIASTDFGCRFHSDWLESIITPFKDLNVKIVGGSYTVKEEDQITLAAKAAYILANGYTPDVKSRSFIPSSRSIAYRKEVFNKVGGYCEWLTLAADDLVFGMEVIARGYTYYSVNKPYVYWIRHSTTKGFIKEAARYGLGDGEARVNTRNFISNSISLIMRFILVSYTVIFLFIMVSYKLTKFTVLPYIILLIYSFRSYFTYTKNWIKFRSHKYNISVYLYGFFLLEKTRISYVLNYIRGRTYSNKIQKQQAKMLKERLSRN